MTIAEQLPEGDVLVVDDHRFEVAMRLTTARAMRRRRRLMAKHVELTADQVADLNVMRWFEEERALDTPGWASVPARTRGVRL